MWTIGIVIVGRLHWLKLVVSTSADIFWSLKLDLEFSVYQGFPIGISSLSFTSSDVYCDSDSDVCFITECESLPEECDVFRCPMRPDLTGISIIVNP